MSPGNLIHVLFNMSHHLAVCERCGHLPGHAVLVGAPAKMRKKIMAPGKFKI